MSQQLVLKKDQDRRLRAGHVWIYSNEVDTGRSPLKDLPPGEPVSVVSHRGNWIGWGYVNPHSLICARMVSRDHPLSYPLIEERLGAALSLRERLYPEPFYRLAFGEADGLPGLVVDRYGDVVVAQIATAGMERQRDAIIDALTRLLAPRAVVLRNDGSARALEGLPSYVEIASGTLADPVEVREGGATFRVSVTEGQKTGWFFDQAANRDRLAKYVSGRRVLDVFSYVGAWSIRAALDGASAVVAVDSSERALEQGHQGPDHPVHPAITETAYLKAFYLRALPVR